MPVSPDIEQGRIDETLAAYRELQSQFERLRERLRLAEGNRHTVNRRIYDKVRAEYDRELDALRSQMTPLRERLDEMRVAVEGRLAELAKELTAAEEELAEATFRHVVGEYTDADIAAKQREMETRLEEKRSFALKLKQTLASLEVTENPETTAAPEDLADEPAPTPAPTPARPVLKTADLASRNPAPPARQPEPAAPVSADRFENPLDWIDEIGRDPLRADSSVSSAASPADKPDDSKTSAHAVTATAPNAAPSLVFVNGTHTGQSIPLLPTTLTIGREHDNNIEIKDAEVARYHARILYERGNYFVEDMESTTGTWVNGQRVRRAPLHHGDVIKVGQTELAIDFEWTAGLD